jgi:hypothetical protein
MTKLKLELSQSKTLITHAASQAGAVPRLRDQGTTRQHEDHPGRRAVNGAVGLFMPRQVIRQRCALYLQNGKPAKRGGLLHDAGLVEAQSQRP